MNRKEVPSKELLKQLLKILDDALKSKNQLDGEPFKAHHITTITGYKKFVLYLEHHIKNKITYNQEMFRQQQQDDKNSHKRTGFPCFFIATQWLNDFNRIIRDIEQPKFINPLTNFAIINDVFEAYQFTSEMDKYKNIYVFPAGNSKSIISKKLWLFYCSMFSGDNQFGTIKRIYNEKTHYYASN